MDIVGKDLALLAHDKAIAEIAEIQQRMAVRHMMQQLFGAKALPQQDFYRRLLSHRQQTLANAPHLLANEAKADENRLAKLYAIVEALEVTFMQFHEASDEAWAEGLAAYFREQQRHGQNAR